MLGAIARILKDFAGVWIGRRRREDAVAEEEGDGAAIIAIGGVSADYLALCMFDNMWFI